MAEFRNLKESLALKHWLAAAESNTTLAFEFAKLFFDFFNWNGDANGRIFSPGLWILATWAMLAATLRPKDCAEARTIDD